MAAANDKGKLQISLNNNSTNVAGKHKDLWNRQAQVRILHTNFNIRPYEMERLKGRKVETESEK